jgi:hypothetical protein
MFKSVSSLLAVFLVVTFCGFVYSRETEVNDLPNTCTICEFILGTVIGDLGKDKTPTKIKNALLRVCNSIPSFLAAKCNEMVNNYGTQIEQYIADGKSAESTCIGIKLCSA